MYFFCVEDRASCTLLPLFDACRITRDRPQINLGLIEDTFFVSNCPNCEKLAKKICPKTKTMSKIFSQRFFLKKCGNFFLRNMEFATKCSFSVSEAENFRKFEKIN